MPEITEDEIKESVQLVKELREKVEKFGEGDAVATDEIKKITEKLDQLETKNQDVVTKQLESEKAALEEKEALESKLNQLEAAVCRFNAGGGDNIESKAEIKALEAFLMKGRNNLEAEELKYLRTDSDTDGGYLAPNEYVNEIIKQITEVSPVRSVARIRRTSSKAIEVPTRTGLVSGGWTGEGGTKTDDQSSYGMIEIPVNKLTVVTIATVEMLADAAFNIETELNADIVEDFAQREGAAFVNGDAIKKPQGFLQNSDIQVINSGVANAITADSLIEITGELKDGYNGVYMLNRRTLATIRTLKDGQGQYLWQNGLAAGLPNTINGDRYVSAIDMPDIAANAFPVAYGDFGRGYTIVDGVQIAFVRDAFTLADQGKVRVVAHRRVGGQTTQPEAIKKIKIAV